MDPVFELREPASTRRVEVGGIPIGGGAPLVVIAGPCVVEGEDTTLRVAEGVARACRALGMPLIFKASLDKANRTSGSAARGIGWERALAVLQKVRQEVGVPVTTDVHEAHQPAQVAEVVELLQVPAFLCRQTDLLVACATTGRAVNVKKGQFLSPWDMAHVTRKLEEAGARAVLQTERGSSFGYGQLVVDMRALEVMRQGGWPVVFDASHAAGAAALPGGGPPPRRVFIPALARAAVAAGVDALFLEVHPDPVSAWSDGPTQIPLEALPTLLAQVRAMDQARRALPGLTFTG